MDSMASLGDKYFAEYIRIEVKHFRDTLLQHMGNVKKSIAKRTQSTQWQYDSSKVSGNDTDTDDVDIRPIYDEEPMAEVNSTSINVQKELSLDFSAGTLCDVNKENLRVSLLKKKISSKPLSQ
ncbi:hypothetical protein Tco_0861199 [Tanacetum coccineum]|uniref:Uncharacterized protein n=1 Tax=Tanacetum coccineum TaxID=301880 RepID=A0ABQ5BK56_9ASTR